MSHATPREDRGNSTLVLLVAAAIVNNLPMYLTSVLFVQIAASTDAPIAALGAIVATTWIAAAIISNFAGSLAHVIGSDRVALVAIGLSIVSFVGTAFFTPDWPMLFIWAIFGGGGVAFGVPSASHLMTQRVPLRRMAFAFGIRQGAIPLTSIVAGLAIPVIALTLGWRFAFGFAAVFGVALIVVFRMLLPRIREPETDEPRAKRLPLDPALRRYLLLVSAFAFLGAGAMTTTISFAVTSAVHRGISPATAGFILTGAGLGGVVVRVGIGILADRGKGGTLLTMSGMLAIGAVGVALISVQADWSFAVGLFIAMSFGWGWPGLLHYIVARRAGDATVAAAGLIAAGNYVGSAIAPFAIGLVYSETNDMPTWLILTGMLSVSAIGAWLVSRRDAREASAAAAPEPA